MQEFLTSMKNAFPRMERICAVSRRMRRYLSSQPAFIGSARSFASALLVATAIAVTPAHLPAQASPAYDADFEPVNFDFSDATRKVGGNSLEQGAVHLYESVITIETGDGVYQEVDAIVRTVELQGKSLTTYDATSQSAVASNSDTNWFMPLFDNATGYGVFQFEFIEHGSYNDATHTGDPVTLQNVYVNSFDIDGSGQSNTY